MDTFRTKGRAKSSSSKTTVEECISLPIGLFTKDGISGGVLEWRSRKSAGVVFTVSYLSDRISQQNDPYLLLQHSHPATGDTLTYRVQLVATEPLLGGQRWGFLCPGVSGRACNLIVRKLYLPVWGTGFACRHCRHLCYRTQRQDARQRALSRAQAVRRRLGASGSVYEPIPDKPPRMRWQTYQVLRDKAIQAEKQYFGASGSSPLVMNDAEQKEFSTTATAALPNPKREEFAQHLANGLNGKRAYVAAGYGAKCATQSASRLRRNPAVAERVTELLSARSAAAMADAVAGKIATSNPSPTRHLQLAWECLREVLAGIVEERGAALADETAGGGTGLVRKSYKHGRPVYQVDLGVLRLCQQLLGLEHRAAEESADWPEHYDCGSTDRTQSKSEEEIFLVLLADITAKISAQRDAGSECPESRGESQAPPVNALLGNSAESALQPEGALETGLVARVASTVLAPAAGQDELGARNVLEERSLDDGSAKSTIMVCAEAADPYVPALAR